MDITLSILPWKIIWNLEMTKKEKIGVLAAMSMGVLSVSPSMSSPILQPPNVTVAPALPPSSRPPKSPDFAPKIQVWSNPYPPLLVLTLL
jgi:hypothetical protein